MIMVTEKRIMDALAAKVKGIAAGKVKPTGRKPRQIDVALRQAIKASGLTHYAIGQAAGVAPSQIDRFMMAESDPRHRDLRLATAARIAAVIGLELIHAVV
jgi:hypothetical protein